MDGDDPVTGCQERYQCCKIDVTSKVQGCKSKFDCCDGKVKSRGCEELCKKCDRAWGTPAEGCYEKEHNIIDTTPNLKPQPEKKRNLLAWIMFSFCLASRRQMIIYCASLDFYGPLPASWRLGFQRIYQIELSYSYLKHVTAYLCQADSF